MPAERGPTIPDFAGRPRIEGPCREHPDWFFPHADDGRTINRATAICRYSCPFMLACRAQARERHERYGIWGGETSGQRQRWLREQRKARKAALEEAA